ncbi:MAG: hypothetical protein QXY18_06230 [Nitrososphaerota archaeon]
MNRNLKCFSIFHPIYYELKINNENIKGKHKKFSNKEIKYASNFVNKLYRSYGGKDKIKIKQEKIENNILAKTNLSTFNEIILNNYFHDFITENFKEILVSQTLIYVFSLKKFKKIILKYLKNIKKENIIIDLFNNSIFGFYISDKKFQDNMFKLRMRLIDIFSIEICAKKYKINYFDFFLKIKKFKEYGYISQPTLKTFIIDTLKVISRYLNKKTIKNIERHLKNYIDCPLTFSLNIKFNNKYFSKKEINHAKEIANKLFMKYTGKTRIKIKQQKINKKILSKSDLLNKEIILNTLYHDFIIQNIREILAHHVLYFVIQSGINLSFIEAEEMPDLYFTFPLNKKYIDIIKKERRLNIHEICVYEFGKKYIDFLKKIGEYKNLKERISEI